MNRYQPSKYRLAFGITAMAAAAINFLALVVLPARLDATDAVIHVATGVRMPHVDMGREAQARDARERRHRLIARAVTGRDTAAEPARTRAFIIDTEDKP